MEGQGTVKPTILNIAALCLITAAVFGLADYERYRDSGRAIGEFLSVIGWTLAVGVVALIVVRAVKATRA